MKTPAAAIRNMQPAQLWRWTQPVLYGSLGLGLLIVLLSAWLSVTMLLVISALMIAGIVGAVFLRDEVALVCAILVGFIAAARYEAGFQMEEVLYGLLYVSFLAYWFVSRIFFYRDHLLRTKVDWALLLFLVYATLSLVLTPMLGGEMKTAISEWLSISMLAFYFPIRELCIRHRERLPQRAVLISLAVVALFIALRNGWLYVQGLQDSRFLWQIATGRVVMNEHVLMMAGLVALAVLVHTRHRLHAAVLAGLFVIYTTGVVIGQSRAVWVSFALGLVIIFLCVDRKEKGRMVMLGVVTVASASLVGALMFEDFFTLIVAGLVNRFASLQTAAVQDVSLINRFVEMAAVWEYIKLNPIIGYGFGVPYEYYSLVYEWTHSVSFIHNGYVGAIYKHGIVGSSLLFTYFFGAAWNAFRGVRASRGGLHRVLCISVLACLAAAMLVCNSENVFATSDKTLYIGVLTGIASASWLQIRESRNAGSSHRT